MLLKVVSILAAGAFGAAEASLRKPVVQTGLDVLIRSSYSALHGKKVLVLTNPTGITPDLDLGVDVMVESGSVDLVGVMGPEHGFRGTSQNGNGEATFVDAKTGLTVYDAYNVNTTVIQSYIKESGADTLMFDIQDVGARFYTYTWAMYDSMVAAAMSNISYVVLDRPNPITGLNAFGPVLNESFVNSYVGRRAIAQAHGMTAGEMAKMFVGEGWIKESAGGLDLPSLNVVEMKGWKRSMDFVDTKLPWVLPSPNMPTLDTAMLYPGTCMFEGTSISEGRGTARPFEIMGAPWTNESWTTAMRDLQIPYTDYRFQCFTPTTSKFDSTISCGLQTYMAVETDYAHSTFDPVYVGVGLLWTARHLYANGSTEPNEGNYTASFHWRQNGDYYDIDLLVGSPLIREGIETGLHPSQIKAAWKGELDLFKKRRSKYLLY
ncbi:hypothetical protein CMQ_71 [Grosmannia clavigera kw1407]|uniref:Uncharacterized protein n=1 Tax=Grosmannia clavigera (strain kw1407 / UAMH 11150) TaxID=655863 RepID=F0XQT4_GROCL|nr:uncharacterized protein CMQ_71 [Grosmannia clavigera kw1407]EFW99753.1 hypothetical protein CMQ_71 [Grosmannia clavigera kw1407]